MSSNGRLPFLIVAMLLGAIAPRSMAQIAKPVDLQSSLTIENTNAAFVPTDVNIPQANPARPTVTIPAHIPPTGYLQLEQGFLHAGSSPGGIHNQNALTQITKISLTTRVLLQFITEPIVKSSLVVSDQHGEESVNAGDLNLGVQFVAVKCVGVVPTLSLAYVRRLRTGAAANLDIGDAAQSFLVMLGGDLPLGLHYDSNLIFNEQTDQAIRRAQFGQTMAVSRPILASAFKQRLSGIIELSHFTQPLAMATRSGDFVSRANATDWLFVAAYSVRPNLILDGSYARGLTSTSTQQQISVGFTYLVPHRLWHDRHPTAITVKKP